MGPHQGRVEAPVLLGQTRAVRWLLLVQGPSTAAAATAASDSSAGGQRRHRSATARLLSGRARALGCLAGGFPAGPRSGGAADPGSAPVGGGKPGERSAAPRRVLTCSAAPALLRWILLALCDSGHRLFYRPSSLGLEPPPFLSGLGEPGLVCCRVGLCPLLVPLVPQLRLPRVGRSMLPGRAASPRRSSAGRCRCSPCLALPGTAGLI